MAFLEVCTHFEIRSFYVYYVARLFESIFFVHVFM